MVEDEEEPGTPVLAACRASSDRILEQAERHVDGACSADRDIDSGGGDEPTLKDFLDGPASKHGVGGGLALAGLWAAVAKAFSCAPFSAGGGREYPARS
mmetsp:Transcript_4153/g.14843  ORF Transcript_4153/g.14843 Transcript_4153/m.14843 type:complete len:99 (+) Transcript_4153:209-505(+)